MAERAQRGAGGTVPPLPPAPSLQRDSRPRRHASPAPSRATPRNPDPGRRAPRRAAPAPCALRPAGGLRAPPAVAPSPSTQRARTRDDVGARGGLPTLASPRELLALLGRASCWVAAGEPGNSVRVRSALGLVSLARPLALHLLGCAMHPDVSLSPASGAEGRNSAVHFPRGPNLSSVASGTPHPGSPAKGSTVRKEPFPSGFCALTEGIPRGRGRVEVLFYFLIVHVAFVARLHRRHR